MQHVVNAEKASANISAAFPTSDGDWSWRFFNGQMMHDVRHLEFTCMRSAEPHKSCAKKCQGRREDFRLIADELRSFKFANAINSARDIWSSEQHLIDKHFELAEAFLTQSDRARRDSIPWQTFLFALNLFLNVICAACDVHTVKNEIAVSEKVICSVVSCFLRHHAEMIFWFTMWQSFLSSHLALLVGTAGNLFPSAS